MIRRPVTRAFVTAFVLLCGTLPLRAEEPPNLEELERRIEAAKRDQAAQAETARKKAAVEASRATLVVRTDAECALSVNGAAQGVLAPNATRSLKVAPGQQLLECVSSEEAAAQVSETASVEAGKQAVVVLRLAEALETTRRAAAEARQREADARACARKPACMVQAGAGIVRQPATGLEWTQADNGRDIDWHGAKRYCEGKGEGWRLPDNDELYAIYDAAAAPIACGWSSGCKVSPLFKLTGVFYWSGTAEGSSEAWLVLLVDGDRRSYPVSYALSHRALCVRRS